MRCGESLFGLGLLGLGGLDLLGELLGLLQQCRPFVRDGGAHLLAGGLLLGAQVVGGRNRGPPGRVGFQQRVDEAGSSPRARCDARTTSGFSRSSLRSITAQPYRREHNPITLQLPHLSQPPSTPVTMERMLDAPDARPMHCSPTRQNTPLEGGVVAQSARHIDPSRAVVDRARRSADRRAAHRAAARRRRHGLTASAISLGLRGNETFDNAKSGDCLNWPERTPDEAEIVDCKDEHRFEVAESVDMRTFPGSEYGPDAAPPSPPASSRSARSSARWPCGATSATGSTPTAASPSA